MQSVLLLAPFFILTAGASNLEGDKEQDEKEQFVAAYEPAVKRVMERLTRRCQAVVHEQSFEGGILAAEATLELLANERCIRVKTTEKAAGDTGNTPASITWHLLRPDGAYKIREAKKAGEYLLSEMRLGEIKATEAGWPFTDVTIPLMRFNHFLLAHIQKPDVKVLHFRETVKDGDSVRELKVNEKINNFSFVSTYYFDASQDWLLQSFIVEPTDGSDRVTVRTWYQTVDGERVPKRVESYSISRNGVSQHKFIINYDSFQRADPPESEFSLSQFDLPEPIGFKSLQPSRTWLWLLAATLVSATVAMLFAWLKRRHARMTSHPNPSPPLRGRGAH